jgi:hypothetical protein
MNTISTEKKANKSTYREVKIGKTTYCVTSVFNGEKQLGATLERLAVQKVIDEMNKQSQQILHS